MKAKLISDGTSHGSKVVMDGGPTLEGVTRVQFELDADSFGKLDLTLIAIEVEVEGEPRFFGVHPIDGDQRQIAKIIYEDGSEWSAP